MRVLAVFVLTVLAPATWAQVPPPPAQPTVENCRAYMLNNQQRRTDILKEHSACVSKSTWNFSDRYSTSECRHPPPTIVQVRSPFNCHQRAAELCALVDAESSIAQCFKIGKASQSMQEERQVAVEKYNRTEKYVDALLAIKKDPRRIFWLAVEPRLPPAIRARISVAYDNTNAEMLNRFLPLELTKSGTSMFQLGPLPRNGDLSARSNSWLQESYDFVYGKTIGNERMMLKKHQNPIIQAIQGTAAGEIRRIHTGIIAKIDGEIEDGFFQITAPASAIRLSVPLFSFPPATTTAPTSAVDSGDPSCRTLDGPGRTALAIDRPEEFERLVEKCRR